MKNSKVEGKLMRKYFGSFLLFAAIYVMLPAGGNAQRVAFKVGEIQAAPGTRASGFLEVAQKQVQIAGHGSQ